MIKPAKRLLTYILILAMALVGFLLITDPYRMPLALLIVPFLLLATIVYLVCSLLMARLVRSPGKVRYIAGVMTGLLMLIVLLQTIRQLSVRDFLIVGALFVGLTFYMRRIDL